MCLDIFECGNICGGVTECVMTYKYKFCLWKRLYYDFVLIDCCLWSILSVSGDSKRRRDIERERERS